MFLVLGCAVPVVALAVLGIVCRPGRRDETLAMRSGARRAPLRLVTEDRWEGFSASVAQRPRRPRCGSDAELRARHLAAVLPADARG